MASLVNMTLDFETTNNNHNNLDGLKRLAETIKQAGALACLQINHAGRFATGGFADRAIAEKKNGSDRQNSRPLG